MIYFRNWDKLHKCLLFNFWIIKLTKTPILPNCQVPNGFFFGITVKALQIEIFWKAEKSWTSNFLNNSLIVLFNEPRWWLLQWLSRLTYTKTIIFYFNTRKLHNGNFSFCRQLKVLDFEFPRSLRSVVSMDSSSYDRS